MSEVVVNEDSMLKLAMTADSEAGKHVRAGMIAIIDDRSRD